MLKTYLPQNITSRQEAEKFLTDMYNNNEWFDTNYSPYDWIDRLGRPLTAKEAFRMEVLILQIRSLGVDIDAVFRKCQMEEEAKEYDHLEAMDHATPEMIIEANYEGRAVKFVGFYVFEELIILN